MKWEPFAAMLVLLALGMWLVSGGAERFADLRPGAVTFDLRIGQVKGVVEVVESPSGEFTFRVLYRDGVRTEILDEGAMRGVFGDAAIRDFKAYSHNPLFRLFNITTWGSLAWILIGLGGQTAFFGRMFIQWLVSEKQQRSVVPEAFWWLSLGGGIMLFAYFVWRQDFVGVLGQTTGVVIYARNVRLIHKRRRRARRGNERRKRRVRLSDDPAPEPAIEPDRELAEIPTFRGE